LPAKLGAVFAAGKLDEALKEGRSLRIVGAVALCGDRCGV